MTIPRYALYGDPVGEGWREAVHVEQIHERSSLFDYEIAPHVHQGLLQLLHLTRGGGLVTVDGRRWRADAPALVIVPAGRVHAFRFSTDVDGPVVTAAQAPLEALARIAAPTVVAAIRAPSVIDVAAFPRQSEGLAPLFEVLARECRVRAAGEPSAGAALLLSIIIQVARMRAGPPSGGPLRTGPVADGASRPVGAGDRVTWQIERFRLLVDAHFRDRWPVARYAQAIGLSAGHLSRLCRATLGASASAVVHARVLQEAQRELVYSTLGVKQVAASLGFADEAYFGRFFRQQCGMSPGRFRDEARGALAGRSGAADRMERNSKLERRSESG